MCDRLDALGLLGSVELSVVFFDNTDRLGDYRTHHQLPDEVRLVADPERRAYAAFDFGRGSWWKVWGPRTFLRYASLLRGGRRYHRHRPGSDTLQLGGDVVIGRDGRIAAIHRPDEPDARVDVAELIGGVTDP